MGHKLNKWLQYKFSAHGTRIDKIKFMSSFKLHTWIIFKYVLESLLQRVTKYPKSIRCWHNIFWILFCFSYRYFDDVGVSWIVVNFLCIHYYSLRWIFTWR